VAKSRYVAGLDAGSDWIRYAIGVLENDRLRLLGAARAPAAGWSKGRIADQRALVGALETCIREAERSAGVSAPGAVVGMGGATTQGLNSRGLYEMGRPRRISETETRFAVEQALDLHMPADRMILQAAPQDFVVDGRAQFWNPEGAQGSRLESFVHLVTVSQQEHQCLVSAVHQAHLAVEETVFEAYAAAYAALTSEERAEGVAVLDIGAQSTELAVYWGDALLAAASLPVSGRHFTADVSHGLCIGFEDAERLKLEWGCAMLGLTGDSNLIEVPSPEGRQPRDIPRLELNRILEARAGDLFLRAKREIAKAGLDQAPLGGVVLAGGGALLNGMCDIAERVLNCLARNGLAVGIVDWPEELDNPAWTTAAGLLLYAARLKQAESGEGRPAGLWNRLFG